jgi:hypothetical protein
MKLDMLLKEMEWAENIELRDALEWEWNASQERLPTETLPFLLS